MFDQNDLDWVKNVKGSQWELPLRVVLDVLEPISPLGAQFIWLVKPAFSVFDQNDTLGKFAELLEDSDGIEALREALDNTTTS